MELIVNLEFYAVLCSSKNKACSLGEVLEKLFQDDVK